METVLQDLRFAARALRRERAFTLLAVLTLALGIGASSAVYSVLRAVVLRPLPYPQPERLVRVLERTPRGEDFAVSVPTFRDLRDGTRSFTTLAALAEREVALLGQAEPVRLRALAVTDGYFALLGARPALGRVPARDEVEAGARVALLGHRAWSTQFGAAAAVVGRTIVLDGEEVAIVGVLPRGFESPGDPDLWLPLRLDPRAEREDHELTVLGRLAEGVDAEGAAAELAGLAARLSAQHPETNEGWGFRVEPLRDWLVPPATARTVWLLVGGVALLLLLTCADVSSLLLGRAAGRRREMGVRAALGAGRRRILRQLLTESVLLAALGALGGALLAAWGVTVLRRLLPAGVPQAEAIVVDGGILAFAAALAGLTAAAFGLAPALAASGAGVREAAAGLRTTGTRSRTRDALVVVELALATTLLVGAGLLLGSLLRLRGSDLGIDRDRVVAVPLSLSPQGGSEDEVARRLLAVEEKVGALPGVAAVGASNVAPLGGFGTAVQMVAEGTPGGPQDARLARWRSVTPGFFRAAGVRVPRGRALRAADYAPGAAPVVVVTGAFARALYGERDPLGRRVAMGVGGTNWRTVVGVAEDVQDVSLGEPPQPVFFMPQLGWPTMTLMVRLAPGAEVSGAALRQAIWSVDPDLPVPLVEPMSARVEVAVARPRFQLLVMGCFAAAALALAAVGIYGVIGQFVALQRRELGVRMALGAAPSGILGLVLRRGARLVLAGIALGGLAALALARAIASLLYETAPNDPAVFAAVALLLALVGLVSTLAPARRAARVDPLAALRAD